MRFRALLLSAWIGVVPRVALGQSATAGIGPTSTERAPGSTDGWVTVESVAPLPSAGGTPVPRLGAPPDVTRFEGRRITAVNVVLDGDAWGDEKNSALTGVKSGDPFSAAVARRALDEILESGRFARGRVSAREDGDGVLLEIRVVPRRLIGRLRLDVHGASMERDEALRDADLAEGGEIVGADLALTKARIRRNFALHGYPAARADITVRPMDDARVLVVVDVAPGPPRIVA